ncbi:MAG: PQQ-binding-like beta-propeller repeat protein [Verrucomicrobia bacterium]|nr:PQQ-binding-like beta-propeller repeat protein [Verrucomicrobiota bacterium]
MTNRLLFAALVAGSFAGFAVHLHAADWPQYRGPNQDGISPESISAKWPASGPNVVWKSPTRNGFSSFAVSDGKAFTQVLHEGDGGLREVVVALDAGTGKELWFGDVGPGKYDSGGDSGAPDNKGGDGPRSTPTVSAGKVYTYNQHLLLNCFDAQTGKLVWKKDVAKDHAGRNIGWKSAMSPVVDGDLIFVAGGGVGRSFLALNKSTGDVVWKSGDEKMTHATPVVATIHGVRQIIFFMQSGLVSVATKDGKGLWKFPFPYKVSTAASPVVAGDIVYCSAGYGVGGGACRIVKSSDGFAAQELWKIAGDAKVANHWSTPVVKDGHLYGNFSFKKYAVGPLKCVELASGEVKWEQPGFGAGNVLLAGNCVVALTDDGQVVLVEAKPAAYKELARAKAVEGKCWSTPALSNGRLYVRSTKEGACLDVSAAAASR